MRPRSPWRWSWRSLRAPWPDRDRACGFPRGGRRLLRCRRSARGRADKIETVHRAHQDMPDRARRLFPWRRGLSGPLKWNSSHRGESATPAANKRASGKTEIHAESERLGKLDLKDSYRVGRGLFAFGRVESIPAGSCDAGRPIVDQRKERKVSEILQT